MHSNAVVFPTVALPGVVRLREKMAKRSRKSNKGSRKLVMKDSGHLPMIRNPDLVKNGVRIRYILSGTSTMNVEAFQLINSIFVHPESGSVVQSVVDSIRLQFVEVWVSSVQGGSSQTSFQPVTVNVGFRTNSNFGTERFKSDTSMSTSPAHVKLVANRREASGMWQSSAGNQQWTIAFGTLPIYSVVDFVFDVRLHNAIGAASENNNISVTTTNLVGTLAFINLCQPNNTQSSVWIPQGVNYTT